MVPVIESLMPAGITTLLEAMAMGVPVVASGVAAKALPNDVRVLTHSQLDDAEREFWSSNTPIGFIFALGVFLGLVVGIIIVYQILYTDVLDHLPQFATLKARGGPQQAFGIGMARMAQNFHGGAVFNDSARIHYDNSIRDLSDYTEIMGNKEQG